MKSQQIAVYASLNEFMVAVGYQNAGDRREDDPVWSTLNQNNYTAMMEYKFGVDTRFASVVPTNLAAVHEGITGHEAWTYLEALEHEDGEEAPVPVFSAPAQVEAAPEGEVTDAGTGTGEAAAGGADSGEGTGEPASTEQAPEGGQSQEPAQPVQEQQPEQPKEEAPKEPEAPAEQPKAPEAPAAEQATEEPKEPAADEGGNSAQE